MNGNQAKQLSEVLYSANISPSEIERFLPRLTACVERMLVEEQGRSVVDLRDLAAEAITILSTCPDADARTEQYERLHKRLVGLRERETNG